MVLEVGSFALTLFILAIQFQIDQYAICYLGNQIEQYSQCQYYALLQLVSV
jgi:hypothetical protein